MMATTATVALPRDLVTVARDGVEARVDGVILPPIINTEVIFDTDKKHYVKMEGKAPYVNFLGLTSILWLKIVSLELVMFMKSQRKRRRAC